MNSFISMERPLLYKPFRSIDLMRLLNDHTTSDKPEAKYCVAGYIIKPVDFPKFVDAVNVISLYWSLSEVP